jgi:hypothetical protein
MTDPYTYRGDTLRPTLDGITTPDRRTNGMTGDPDFDTTDDEFLTVDESVGYDNRVDTINDLDDAIAVLTRLIAQLREMPDGTEDALTTLQAAILLCRRDIARKLVE